METTPPCKSTGREIVERVAEAALGSVPVVEAALAVTFVTALDWRLEERREKWFTELADGVEALRQRKDGLSLESLAGNDLLTEVLVMATWTVEHSRQAEKIQALRNAVLNSVAPGAPDADAPVQFGVLLAVRMSGAGQPAARSSPRPRPAHPGRHRPRAGAPAMATTRPRARGATSATGVAGYRRILVWKG